jgi:DNA (cytosine-5)-methyltransferase 1
VTAYYNEIDPLKAETLREAIKAGAIAPGDVDERSIADVEPADLVGYTQCHFFAGGGFWSLALRWAGWPDDRPVWTGSCPCPSFSTAGKGGGFDDPRHLWPYWDRLIDKSRPPVIFGEQADDAIGFGWLDLVQTDLEAKTYSLGAVVFGAHSVGAGHIRQRLYFSADTEQWTAERQSQTGDGFHAIGEGLEGLAGDVREWRGPGWLDPEQARSIAAAGATRGFWADCDWWYGRDGKYRPIGPGIFPLAHGSAARVGRLRMYGDGIVVTAAQAFIESYCEARGL